MKKPILIEDLRSEIVAELLAKHFNTSIESGEPINGFDLPHKIGSGFLHAYSFIHGIDTSVFNLSLKSPLVIKYQYPLVCPLRFIYNVSGNFDLEIEGQNTTKLSLEPSQFTIFSASTECYHTLSFNANSKSRILIIDIYRKEFEEKIEQFVKYMDKELVGIFRDLNGILKFNYLSTYPKRIALLIEELLDSDHENIMKSVFVEGKTQEIIANTIQTYLDTKAGKGFYLNGEYLKRLEEAERIIQNDFAKIPSISAIAKSIGLNQNKLQEGFKHLHKMSVHSYIRKLKIAKARDLLESTNFNITEVSERIGINSKSYFSKLFKEFYGVSPKNYQIRYQEERNSKSA